MGQLKGQQHTSGSHYDCCCCDAACCTSCGATAAGGALPVENAGGSRLICRNDGSSAGESFAPAEAVDDVAMVPRDDATNGVGAPPLRLGADDGRSNEDEKGGGDDAAAGRRDDEDGERGGGGSGAVVRGAEPM